MTLRYIRDMDSYAFVDSRRRIVRPVAGMPAFFPSKAQAVAALAFA